MSTQIDYTGANDQPTEQCINDWDSERTQEVFRIRITITLVLDSVPLIGGEVPPRSHLRQVKPWTKGDFEVNVQVLEDWKVYWLKVRRTRYKVTVQSNCKGSTGFRDTRENDTYVLKVKMERFLDI